ncbi:hypothetical protein WJX73_009218 [Symbiochloris irregularis]|uniref:Alpha galactosidase C-terminal domain-containing protein n=1 Tax=Symbiochloris irregularis TaxID=706552 RepID=A0AAW1NIR7_9CHLO
MMQVYAGPLQDGSRAVVLFNRHIFSTQYPLCKITVTWEQLGYAPETKANQAEARSAARRNGYDDKRTQAFLLHWFRNGQRS